MFKDLSNGNYPATLFIRNTEGGMIWQVYHVDNPYQMHYISKGATSNGFESITLEDYQPNHTETFPNWKQEMAEEFVRIIPSHIIMKSDSSQDEYEFGEWECAEGTLHGHNEECYCARYEPDDEPMYEMTEEEKEYERMRELDDMYGDDLDQEMKLSADYARSEDPEYIIASTSYKMEETYLFEANEKGEIVSWSDYGGLAYRWGDKTWMLRPAAVQAVFPDKYQYVKDLVTHTDEVHHSLYKRI